MAVFDVGGKPVGDGQPVFIVAECGINHNGELGTAIEMIDAAAAAGADAVKFQLFRAAGMYTPRAGKYKTAKGEMVPIYELMEEVELPLEWLPDLSAACRKADIKFIMTVCDEWCVRQMEQADFDCYKVASYEISHVPMLIELALHDKPIIISSGAANISDVVRALVVADRDVSLEFADVVLLDNERAGYEATRHLLELGHRNIACITGPYDLSPSMQRMEGFKRCLSEFGIQFQPQLIQTGDFSIQSGKVATLRLLSAGPKPTAIFALNDMMAIGAMSAVNQAGLSIPGDMSLIGFDNIELAGMVTPSLTTVAQPIPEIARQATSLLIERLAGTRNGSNQKVILSAELLLRDSTARLE